MLGYGSGRNLPPLIARGIEVDIIESNAERAREATLRFVAESNVRIKHGSYAGPYPFSGTFDAALSTHALLHGTAREVELAVRTLAHHLVEHGVLFATFGSTRDPRFASGDRIDAYSRAPRDGSERGVVHAYFDERRLRTMLASFAIERCEEASASESAGRWAHDAAEAASLVHWFVRAKRRC